MLKRIAWDKDNKTDIELKEYKYKPVVLVNFFLEENV